MHRLFHMTTLILILYGFANAGAQGNGHPGRAEVAQIQTVKINGQIPKLDGKLDEPVWNDAIFVSGFAQKEPDEGTRATEKTEIAFLYDEDALYIGARLFSKSLQSIQAQLTRRDRESNVDRLVISLDTYHDRRTAYSFGVTAAGVRIDYYHPEDNAFHRDFSFDPVWEARTHLTATGWSAEIRIPFSQLRFSKQEIQTWGVNVVRYIPAHNEEAYWQLVPKNETGWASRFGELTGISGITPERRIEVLPYISNNSEFTSDVAADNPFTDGSDLKARTGFDLKMGLGPNLTLDATVNPDFGQVEADPAEMNLSAFETFFSERRPFFTEGAQLLRGSGANFFYSRRIGAPPHGLAGGDFVERPDNATILGAAKLTGRFGSGLSIGMLSALTSREKARTFDAASQAFDKAEIEPFTSYNILRLQQEFGASASTLGMILTGVHRDLDRNAPLAVMLHRQAWSGATDWNLRFNGGQYVFRGHFGFSAVGGDSLAMARTQRSSAHFFQRPDADHVSLDSSRTSLAGYTGSLNFSKNSGEHWLWSAGTTMRSPGFEINDAGILGSVDNISTFADLTYRENTPGRLFHSYALSLFGDSDWNFGGTRLSSSFALNANVTLKNFWRGFLHFHMIPRGQSDRLTRGGPLMGTGSNWHASLDLSNNSAAKINWSLDTFIEKNELGGWTFSPGATLTVRSAENWTFSLHPSYSRSANTRQYITSLAGGRAGTYGHRYIFAKIERSTLATQLRLNYVFTPDLSLELYAEPFAASGRYSDHGELLASRSRFLRVYGTDGTTITEIEDGRYSIIDGEAEFAFSNRDFNVLSFRSNVVLRWEWRRGSTLFFVWQQYRSGLANTGNPVAPASLWDALTESGDNFLALKINYWLPVGR